ncbi:MAG: hypothetical protein NVSMB54_33420 [Ktedonobacteraceae bacterium]
MGTPNTNKGTGALPHATTAHSNGNIVPTDITTSLVGSSDEQDEPGQKSTWRKGATRTLRRAGKAYAASLLITGVLMPFVASVATIAVYIAPQINMFQQTLPFLPLQDSNWYAPVYGVLLTGFIWLVVALLGCYTATAGGANMSSYAQMRERWLQLKARLGLQEDAQGNLKEMDMGQLHKDVGLDISEPYQKLALREAYAFCHGISRNLCNVDTGLRWISGSGYTSTWDLIHHAEEALIEVEPVETVLRGAMHDMFAINGSTMNNGDDLLDKLILAVQDLDPLASEYFSEHQPDKSRDRLLNKLIHTVNSEKEVLRQIADKFSIFLKHADNSTDADDVIEVAMPTDKKLQAKARLTLREIRRTLNGFRDGIWDGMVRARNRLLGTIALTGAVTHILLCTAILTEGVNTHTANRDAIIAATAFYIVGAIAGLFGRFYNELSSSKGGDDYGLSLARLIATPLLSGLAGVGGVLVSALVYSKLIIGANDVVQTLGGIFDLKATIYLLVAAIFGLTPNLIIRSLQQQAEKYVSDLKSSKGSEQKSGV